MVWTRRSCMHSVWLLIMIGAPPIAWGQDAGVAQTQATEAPVATQAPEATATTPPPPPPVQPATKPAAADATPSFAPPSSATFRFDARLASGLLGMVGLVPQVTPGFTSAGKADAYELGARWARTRRTISASSSARSATAT